MAELANALGADAVVMGDIARFDDTFQINAKVVSASDATVLAQASRRVRGQVETLEGIASLARELSRALFEKKGRTVPPELLVERSSGGGLRRWSWIPLAGGAAIGGVGGVLLSLANDDAAALRASTGTPIDDAAAQSLRDDGKKKQIAGGACVVVGATALAAGLAMLIFGGSDAPVVGLTPLPGGAAFSLSGVFP